MPAGHEPPRFDENDPHFAMRRMLRFRSWHRGTKESDLLLGSFADQHLAGMTPEQLETYAVLLEKPDHEIYNWKVGRDPVPPELETDIMAMLKAHAISLSEPEE